MQMQKRVSTTVGILIIAVTAVILFSGVFAYQYIATTTQVIVQIQPTQNQTNQTAGWKTYTNTQYGFSIQYPPQYQNTPPDPTNTNDIAEFDNPNDDPSHNISISYFNENPLDLTSAKYGTEKIYFDEVKKQWMDSSDNNGTGQMIATKITPSYTNSGAPFFADHQGIYSDDIIPLSHSTFLIIEIDDSDPFAAIIDNMASTFKFTK